MDTIKRLYEQAVRSRSVTDVDAFQKYIESCDDPIKYISGLEYVITSGNRGVGTFMEFFKTRGLPIALYESAVEYIDRGIEKCESKKIDASKFHEARRMITESTGHRLINMFDFIDRSDEVILKADYAKRFYDEAFKKSPISILQMYGESAIPDLILNGMDVTVISEQYVGDYPAIINQFMMEFAESNGMYEAAESLMGKSIVPMYEKYISGLENEFKVARLMAESVEEYDFCNDDVNLVAEYILYKEHMMCNEDDEQRTISTHNAIMEAVDYLDCMIDTESCADLVGMLPQQPWDKKPIRKRVLPINEYTSNKKTGKPADYLSKHHNLGYGEDDDTPKKKPVPNDEDLSKDDILRPKKNDSEDYDDLGPDNPLNTPQLNKAEKEAEKAVATANHYYNIYYNSFNKKSTTHDSSTGKVDNSTNIDASTTNTSDKKGTVVTEGNNLPNEGITEPSELDLFNEGLGDSLKNFAGKAAKVVTMTAKRISNRLYKKKSLANLQAMDLPSERKKIVPPFILGLNVPIKTKSFKEFVENEVDGTSFAESVGTLSKNDIKNIAARFQKKHNATIVFINTATPMGDQSPHRGGAMMVALEKGKLEEWKNKGWVPSTMPSPDNADLVIAIDVSQLRQIGFKTVADVETMLSHEYGHVMTYSQLTDRDWAEYTQKTQLAGAIEYICRGDQTALLYSNCTYHQLKPESLANSYASLDFADILRAVRILDGELPTDWKTTYSSKVIGYKLPDVVVEVTRRQFAGGSAPTTDDIEKMVSASISIYKSLLPADKASDVIASLEETLQQIKSGDTSFIESHYDFTEAKKSDDDDDLENAPEKPKSDQPIRDTLTDIDRALTSKQQEGKKKARAAVQTGKAIVKPFKRMARWLDSMVKQWKDADENRIKHLMADPHSRSTLYDGIRKAIVGGSLLKAGILLNPIFLALSITNKFGSKKKHERIRNEMIGEIKAELNIIDEKIKDADHNNDNAAKYKLMRLRTEINKKLLRVGGGKKIAKLI